MALSQDLWKILTAIRNRIDVSEFKNYVMPFMFYWAANQKIELLMRSELENDGLSYEEAWNLKDEETGEYIYRDELRDVQLENFGFVIRPENSCMSIVPAVRDNNESFIERFTEAIETFDEECTATFRGSLKMANFDSDILGDDPDFIEDLMFNKLFMPTGQVVLAAMRDNEHDAPGRLYMEIMSHFASSAGKGGGEFFTPLFMSKLVAKLATYNVKNAKSIYDPTCGSGSLLIQAAEEIKSHVDQMNRRGLVGHYYGQEINTITAKQAKINMCMHDIKTDRFNIINSDTLSYSDAMGDMLFDVIVANPPYSFGWDNTGREDDLRFAGYGAVAPAKTADLAFVQHIVYHMEEGGRAAVLLPHGPLFRGNAEKTIRKVLIDKHNVIDAIIGLPSNCFFGASIAVACIVLRKDRNGDSDDICIIDASKYFKTANGKNSITDEDIGRIMDAYANRKDIDHFCSIVPLDKIRENDYSLNIPLYVEPERDETEHNLGELFQDYAKLEKQADDLKFSINAQLASFGIQEKFIGVADTNNAVDSSINQIEKESA